MTFIRNLGEEVGEVLLRGERRARQGRDDPRGEVDLVLLEALVELLRLKEQINS